MMRCVTKDKTQIVLLFLMLRRIYLDEIFVLSVSAICQTGSVIPIPLFFGNCRYTKMSTHISHPASWSSLLSSCLSNVLKGSYQRYSPQTTRYKNTEIKQQL
jgi:hypothetical protein